MTNFAELIRVLVENGVEFIIVGGAAATAEGSARLTQDLDVVYLHTRDNIEKLVAGLEPYQAYIRGAPPGLPFKWSEGTLWNGLNFTLTTSLGYIDLLGEITGGGGYADLLQHSIRLNLFSVECLCLDFEFLIHVKRAAGRPKDFEAIARTRGYSRRTKAQYLKCPASPSFPTLTRAGTLKDPSNPALTYKCAA